MSEEVSVESRSDWVAVVRFSRPPHNYFDAALIGAIADAYERLDEDHRCRAIVLCSRGKHFCAGANFAAKNPAEGNLYEQAVRLFSARKPVVAAVQGAAVGGGLGVALSADFRVASPESRFSANFARLGIHHGFGVTVTLPLAVGHQRALELLYTGARVNGEAAHAMGLCDRLVDADRLLEEAIDFAMRSRSPRRGQSVRSGPRCAETWPTGCAQPPPMRRPSRPSCLTPQISSRAWPPPPSVASRALPGDEYDSPSRPWDTDALGRTQEEKAAHFRALHEGEPFIIPNPWDAGSARALAALGFEALATTSSGFAFTLGRRDGNVTLDELAAHVRLIDEATDLPVSVDLENGYGRDPADAAEAITRAAEAGAVGGSIEDWDPSGELYEQGHATERVAAAVEAAAGLGFPFTLTARAENHIRGNPDRDDTIARLQSYERAGADVLYAPGLATADDVRAVCEAVSKPVNVLAHPGLTMVEIADAGAQRVSVGGALAFVGAAAMAAAAEEMRDQGTFSSLGVRVPIKDWLGERP